MNLPFDFTTPVLHFHMVASELYVGENYHLTDNLAVLGLLGPEDEGHLFLQNVRKNLAHITASYHTRSESSFFFPHGTVAQHGPCPPPS
jgi:hypothetical protein